MAAIEQSKSMDDRETLLRFQEDTRFLEAIRPELLQRYPDCWVAIYNRELVAFGKELRAMLRYMQARGIPPGKTVVQYLAKKPTPSRLISQYQRGDWIEI